MKSNHIPKIFNSVLVLMILFGCNSPESNNGLVEKLYYENDVLRKVQGYKLGSLNDTIKHGSYLYYNENGVLIDSAKITNNKFHGKRFLFYDDGFLKRIITYKNDVYRSSISYDVNGEIEFYRAYNYAKNLMFFVDFDSTGSIVKYEGKPIYSWVIEENYPVGEIVSIELLVPNIPDFETKITIDDSMENENESKRVYSPDEFNRVVYKRERKTSDEITISSYLE